MTDGLPKLALAHFGGAWLLRRDGREDEYRHPARLLDETLERGFNAIAVDAFPHLVAPRPDGVVLDRFEVIRDHREYLAQPRKALLELMRMASERNLKVWLTSRFLADTQSRRSFVRRPRDFVDVWSHTLRVLQQHDLLHPVVAVDWCEHFPLPPAAHGVQRALFRRQPNPLTPLLPWSPAVERRVEQYLHEVPRALKAVFPTVRFGLSVSGGSERHLRKLDTSELDFMDRHAFLDDDPRYALLTGAPVKGFAGRVAGALQGRVASAAWRARKRQWRRQQEDGLHEFSDFCRVRRMTPALTRGYVRLGSEWQADWDFVREVSDFMVRAALGQDIPVITPALYARPHTPALWDRRDWLRELNALITAPAR